jgi:muconolactone delta-isomerase
VKKKLRDDRKAKKVKAEEERLEKQLQQKVMLRDLRNAAKEAKEKALLDDDFDNDDDDELEEAGGDDDEKP